MSLQNLGRAAEDPLGSHDMHEMQKRVLFAACPAHGHVQPLLPLAAAFRDAGWSVCFAIGPEFAERMKADGYSVWPVDGTMGDWFAELERRTGAPPGEGLAPDEILQWFIPRLFAEIGAERMVADLVDATAADESDSHVVPSRTRSGQTRGQGGSEASSGDRPG